MNVCSPQRHVRCLWSILLLIALALAGCRCKSSQDKKDIKEIKDKLNKLLKDPKDMHSSRMDKLKTELSKELGALLKKPDAKRRAKLIKKIEKMESKGGLDLLKRRLMADEIMAINISIDLWTVDGAPAGLLVNNTGVDPLSPQLNISCGAPPKAYPITATLEDGVKQHKHVFKGMGHKLITLPPVPAKSKRLFIITTDKTWTPGTHDKRKLGLRFSVPLRPYLTALVKRPDAKRRAKLLKAIVGAQVTDFMPLVEPTMGTVGLTPDGWTTDSGPGGLIIRNEKKEPMTPAITVSCNAGKASLPVSVTFDSGTRKIKHTFTRAGATLLRLPAVPARSNVLYTITTSKTWKANSKSKVKLGVRISSPLDGALRAELTRPDPVRRAMLLKQAFELGVDRLNVLGNLVVVVGLSGDRWTVAGEPAGLAVHNPGRLALALEVQLSCGASKPADLPVTAVVDDGTTKRKLVFNGPGEKKFTLPAVPPGAKRLFIISTDKTWSPGTHDQRLLGVNVAVDLGKALNALLKGSTPKLWVKLADLILNGRTADTTPLLQNTIVSLGLSPDRWTVGGAPAALVVNNRGAASWQPSLTLRVGARKKDLPIIATLDDGKRKIRVVFNKAETKQVKLPKMPGRSHRLYVITTNRSWTLSAKDPRVLGVNVGVPKGLKAPPPAPKVVPKAAPAKVAPAKVAPAKVEAKGAPAKVAPAKVAPAKVAPAKVAPAKVAPARAARRKAPAKAAPRKAN